MINIVHVAVGVIKKQEDGESPQYFLTKRLKEAHQGGKWEFPGGKVEKGESAIQALARELKEEVDIDLLSCQALTQVKHTYQSEAGDKSVLLDVFIVDRFTGEPKAQEGQGEDWFRLSDFGKLDFPEANKAIIDQLTE